MPAPAVLFPGQGSQAPGMRDLVARYTPELLFEEDDNIAYGVHIASILADVKPEDRPETNSEDDET